MARRTERVLLTSSCLEAGCGFWRSFCFRSLFKYSSGLWSGRVGRQVAQLDLVGVARRPTP